MLYRRPAFLPENYDLRCYYGAIKLMDDIKQASQIDENNGDNDKVKDELIPCDHCDWLTYGIEREGYDSSFEESDANEGSIIIKA